SKVRPVSSGAETAGYASSVIRSHATPASSPPISRTLLAFVVATSSRTVFNSYLLTFEFDLFRFGRGRRPEGRPPGFIQAGGSAGWLTAQRYDLRSSRRARIPPKRKLVVRYAAAGFLRDRIVARTGAAYSTRMNAPSRVRNRNLASTRALSSAPHDAP